MYKEGPGTAWYLSGGSEMKQTYLRPWLECDFTTVRPLSTQRRILPIFSTFKDDPLLDRPVNAMRIGSHYGAALLPIVGAKAILPRHANLTATTFRMFAVNSHSVLDFSNVNASETRFWIGRDTATYCPLLNTTLCPAGTDTLLKNTFGEDTLGLVFRSSPFAPLYLQ